MAAKGLTSSLQRYLLGGISDTGIEVGSGAYAAVFQYDFRGQRCAGKKIHRLLYEHATPTERADMLRRFGEECDLLSRLHHPNIVQFLGVHVETGSTLPVLVMEYLPTNLTSHLDKHGVPPADLSYCILREVVLGLRYLHEYSPPIVHRDLSTNNVLLTANLTAKISDLGVAKILNISPLQKTPKMSTKAPGIPCYMPPEALMTQSTGYGSKIDSFSFGVLILHVLCGEWPFPTDAFQRDPDNPRALIPVTEVDRRARFLENIGRKHPLYELVCQCLSNIPDDRPKAADILQQMDTAISRVPAPPETLFQQLQILRRENQRLETDSQRLSYEVVGLSNKAQGLERENQRLMTDMDIVRRENQQLSEQNRALSSDVEALRSQVSSLENENQELGSEVERLKSKDHLPTRLPSADGVVKSPQVPSVGESTSRSTSQALYGRPDNPFGSRSPQITDRFPSNHQRKLKVTITEAKLTKKYGIARLEPYCRIRAGSNRYETPIDKNGSKNPRWNKTTVFSLTQGVRNMHIEIFTQRFLDHIAWASYDFPERLFDGETVEEWIELNGRQGEGMVGSINMVFSLVPAHETHKSPLQTSFHIDVSSRLGKAPKVRSEDVKHLKEMFPNHEEGVIRSVLEANNGQMDSAVTNLMEV